VFDVLAFATDSFINALVDDTDQRHEFAHFMNERVNFFDRYNQIALELFDLSIVQVEDSHVALTEVYALSKLFDMENYLPLPPVVEGKNNKQRTKEREERARHSWLAIFICSASLTRECWNMVLAEEVQQTRGHTKGGVSICQTSLRRGSKRKGSILTSKMKLRLHSVSWRASAS
jgi:hypothetical protein